MPDETTIPEEFRSWVAKPGQDATELTEPFNIDFRARAAFEPADDLGEYHPGNVIRDRYELKHVHKRDANGESYVAVTEISANWNRKFAAVMEALVLRPERDVNGRILYLEDMLAKTGPEFEMNGWHVANWIVGKNRTTDRRFVHQDIIVWKKDDKELVSLLSWHPYDD